MNRMKSFVTALFAVVFATMIFSRLAAAQSPAPDKTAQAPSKSSSASVVRKSASAPRVLKTQKEKFSYALGMNIGAIMRKHSVELDTAMFLQGLKDAMAVGKPILSVVTARSGLLLTQSCLNGQHQYTI